MATIWANPTEAEFRQDLIQLEHLTNAVPLESQMFRPDDWVSQRSAASSGFENRILSISEEQQLAQDVSFLAAVGEGGQSVAASTIQESNTPVQTPSMARNEIGVCSTTPRNDSTGSLKITLASVDAIDPASQSFMRQIFDRLSETTRHIQNDVADDLFDLVASHHSKRLLNRLRSGRWVKPTYLSRTHKKPLYADFPNLIHRTGHLYPKRRERPFLRRLEELFASLASTLESFEHQMPDTDCPSRESRRRRELIRACYDVCTSPLTADCLKRLRSSKSTPQVQASVKTLQQVEKIAAYYRIPLTLAEQAAKHPQVFRHVLLVYLPPYPAKPVAMAYQPWATATHVHAEINLAVYHDMESFRGSSGVVWARPRLIGASKYLCYLCYLFLSRHGTYFAPATHGACYDQWTVPDLEEYPEELRQRYTKVIGSMHRDICSAALHATKRTEPMTSRENLIGMSVAAEVPSPD